MESAHQAVLDSNLHPLVLTKRCSIAVVTLFDYLHTTIGPYREVSIGVLTSPKANVTGRVILDLLTGVANVGAWIVALPVNSDVACRGGVELFGYPKSVECIDVHIMNNTCSYEILSEGQRSVAFEAKLRAGPKFPIRRLLTYSSLNGQLIATTIPVKWTPTVTTGKGTRLLVINSSHRLGTIINNLKLPKEPILLLHSNDFQATLRAGSSVAATS